MFIIIGIILEFLIISLLLIRRQRQFKKRKLAFINSLNERLPVKNSDELGYNKQCKICKINLESNQEIVHCPECLSVFHLDHLQKWLKVKFHCPICQYDFNELFLKEEHEEE